MDIIGLFTKGCGHTDIIGLFMKGCRHTDIMGLFMKGCGHTDIMGLFMKGCGHKRSWNNSIELRKARSQVQRAHHKFGKYSSQHSAALERLDRSNAFVAEMHAVAIIDDIQSQIYERRTAAAWTSINEFCGRKSTPLSCIKASSIDQVKEKPQRHYANVLNMPPHPLPINDDDDVITVTPDLDPSKVTGPITTAELLAALSTSKLSSSSGPDSIPVIALRIEEFEDNIPNTINQSSKMVDSEHNIPSQWKHSIIVSIPKNGSYSL